MPRLQDKYQEDTLTVEKVDSRPPPMYRVILHNDDYTPMDFVVLVLQQIFHKKHEDAVQIMLAVHRRGNGVCGIYTHEIAETRTRQVTELARQHEYPLKCSMEPE